jgi:hypothetical protein
MFIRLPWATHGCDKSFGGPCGQVATYAVERFLDAVTIDRTPKAPKAKMPTKTVRGRNTMAAR